MADTLYLSLWYPNLLLTALPGKLTAVLGAFATHGGDARVYSATVWPVSWSESPVFQLVYGQGERGAEPEAAVEQALEMFHDDYAYEFQIGWTLWEVEAPQATPGRTTAGRTTAGRATAGRTTADPSTRQPGGGLAQDDCANGTAQDDSAKGTLDLRWAREPRLVRVIGFGPHFDEGAYEQDGHIKIDFGSDEAFLDENVELDATAARHVEENVRQLVELTAAAEKASGATARLLWSELGESLAQRLAARLGMGN